MQIEDYVIAEQKMAVPDLYILKLKPKQSSEVFAYTAGQFVQIRNPAYERPEEPHSFSIATSPTTRDHLEFCYKVYGNWTRALSQKAVGDELKIQGPLGRFTWEDSITQAVFLAGGVGIVPMLAILRDNVMKHVGTPITLLYGNRTEKDIAYRDELAYLISKIPKSRVVNVLSDIKPDDHSWGGYRGFITKEILQKEVDFIAEPIFFLCGPPIFVQLMKDILREQNVPLEHVRQELFSIPPAPRGTNQEAGIKDQA